MVTSLVLVACEPEVIEKEVIVTQVVEKEVVVTEIVEVEGEAVEVTRIVTEEVVIEVTPEAPAEEEMTGEITAYKIALFEDPVSLNYWNYLGPGSSVWTSYVLSGQQPSLYTLSDQRFDFVPSLAVDFPEVTQEGDVWVVTVKMIEGAMWSDGEPIMANDVVFTHNACKDLQLTQNWPNSCAPMGVEVTAEALDDYTVQYTFAEQPSLGTWQAGVALAPIMPEHFWADVAAEAYAFIEGVEAPPEDDDCGAEEPSEACNVYMEAYENARKTLYEADAAGSPSAGGYVTDKWELGAFAQRTANGNYFFAGAEIVEYDDGTWMMTLPDGTSWQAYGNAEGEETLRYISGPYAPNVIFSIYGSQDAAFLALADGEVDYVLNPLGLGRGLKEQAQKGENIKTYTNADYGMYYIAFNMRKYPMSEYEFRQAFDIITDKEFVVNNVLAGVVFPMYSAMPPGNGFWYNPDVPMPYVGLSRAERVEMAVQVLKDAGWTWTQEPAWSDDIQDTVPGEGLVMPNGEPMPELTILGPGPAYDPLRATFNQWISEWARELGMPVQSELTGFNTMLNPVFVDVDFDMYILGWSLGNVAFPDYFESFWHSRNDTAVSGNNNTPGLNSPEYDAVCDEFMSTGDLDRARELVYEMQMILADQRPYIMLFYKSTDDLARGNVIYPYTEVLGGLEAQAGMQTDARPLSQ
jgi:ABC-type transport system substrate-binding protein